MDIAPLRRIGLTDNEIRVYLALLPLGQSTAGPIVDASGVTRSKIYDLLERLKDKGLVSYITKDATKYFSAADPENILRYLDKKEEQIKDDKASVAKLLPELQLQKTLSKGKKMAEVFIGMRGMDNAFNVIVSEFDEDEEYLAFGAGSGEDIPRIQDFFSRIHKERQRARVKSRIIFNESSRGLFRSQQRSRLVQARYLKQSTPAAINIYKDHTIIAILNKEPITFLIHNKETADSFREHFRTMWNLAKP